MSVTVESGAPEPIPGLGADGRPDPAYAASLGIEPAGPGLRSAAFAVDALVWAALASPALIGAAMLVPLLVGTDAAPGGDDLLLPVILIGVGAGLVVLFSIVQLITHGLLGVTLGKAAFKLRSVNVATFAKPGFWRVVVRALVLALAQLVLPIIGPAVLFASSAWDPEARGRSVLDRLARCWLIDARAGLDPFDVKALRHARRAAASDDVDVDERLPSLATGAAPERALRLTTERSRAGVVGSGGTGASWEDPSAGSMPGGGPGAAPQLRPASVTGTTGAPATTGGASAAAGRPSFAPVQASVAGAPAASAAAPAASSTPTPAAAPPPPSATPPQSRREALAQREASVPPGAPPWPPRQSSPTAATLRDSIAIRFDDGTLIAVPNSGLIGRNPEPQPGDGVELAIPVDDPSKLLSKTHVAFGAIDGGIWLLDLGSSNGTEVVGADGATAALTPGERVRIPIGATVRIGGRAFVVERGGQDA